MEALAIYVEHVRRDGSVLDPLQKNKLDEISPHKPVSTATKGGQHIYTEDEEGLEVDLLVVSWSAKKGGSFSVLAFLAEILRYPRPNAPTCHQYRSTYD